MALAAATVVIHAFEPMRCSTSKPVSSEELSLQLTVTLVEPVGKTVTPEGAAGGPAGAVDTTLLGVESPLALVAMTRNS